MRVSNSDVDNWKKLKRGLTSVKNTIKDKIIICAKTLTDLYTWIDADYAVHNNMRGHIGGAISMGSGIMHGKASKQKINVKSSTESGLVGMGKYFPYSIWFITFMGAQGYAIKNIYISRQPKCNSYKEEWTELVYGKLQTHVYQIFLLEG